MAARSSSQIRSVGRMLTMDEIDRDIETVRNWIRKPDWAEEFSLADTVAWLNERPIAAFERIAASHLSQDRRGNP